MALEPVPHTLGLWRTHRWERGAPGVYALVIGVSEYAYLEGGPKQVDETYGMGQLVSSARTAAAIFEWLRNDFSRQGLPVVQCHLLLSPTIDEKQALGDRLLSHYAAPTMQNLQAAIQMWTGFVPQSAKGADSESRTFFFFSGHGIQSNWHGALLPSDYLDDSMGAPMLERCVGVADLQTWMERSAVTEHLALIDACRNEFSPLAAKGAIPTNIFPTVGTAGRPPRTSATLHATSPNAVAFQSPTQPETFFGKAVMEALRSGAVGQHSSWLEFRELADYVKPRIKELLRQAQAASTVDQTARFRLEGEDILVVTERSQTPAVVSSRPVVEEVRSMRSASAGHGGTPERYRTMLVAEELLSAEQSFRASGCRVMKSIALSALRDDLELADRFAAGNMANLWRNGVSSHAIADRARLDDQIIIDAVQRDASNSLVTVDLTLPPRAGGVLMVFEGKDYIPRARLALAMPTDLHQQTPIRLSMSFDSVNGTEKARLYRISARLGPAGGSAAYQHLWAMHREDSVGLLASDLLERRIGDLVDALQHTPAPVVAELATILLFLHVGKARDLLSSNALRHAISSPAGRSLLALINKNFSLRDQSCAQLSNIHDWMATVKTLLDIDWSSTPLFADLLDLARNVADKILELIGQVRPNPLNDLLERINHVFEISVPGGQFFTLVGLPRPRWATSREGPLTTEEMLDALRFMPEQTEPIVASAGQLLGKLAR
ncbi:Uncharacterised protein [Xylophilus ampelinus]|nr:Uncharacterised protein [Xylophilus ampelinus]